MGSLEEQLGHLGPKMPSVPFDASPQVVDYIDYHGSGSKPRATPFWDRETFGDGFDAPDRWFFMDFSRDAQGRTKTVAHTTIPGYAALLPCGYEFMLYGFAGFVDAGSDPAQEEKLFNEGTLEVIMHPRGRRKENGGWGFGYEGIPVLSFPMRLV
ncbi:MAG: hypothetical protein AABY22_23675, partial [Nanoarchaeota archaeon]